MTTDIERTRSALLDAQREAEQIGWSHNPDLIAFGAALERRNQAWTAWLDVAAEAGVDPYEPVPKWRAYALNTAVVTLIGENAENWLAAVAEEGWVSVDHSAVPFATRGTLLATLHHDAEHGGGVFFRRPDGAATLHALVVWTADGRGGIRQEIAVEETACQHGVAHTESCRMCDVGWAA